MKQKIKSIINLIAKFTPLALLAGVYLSTSALPAVAAQSWVRFTYVKKYPAQGTQDVSVLALARFALFDVGGNCLIPDAGLTKGSSATALGVNEFWQNMGDSNAGNLFTSGMTSGTKWSRNSATLPVVWTMRLADNVVPVQYNLAVADVTVTVGKTDLLGRYPTSWKVETSTTGADGSWTTVSEINDVAPPSTASSWYNGGGNNPTPSTFYPLATSSTYTPVTYINAQTRGPALRITGFHLAPSDRVETKVQFNDIVPGGSGAANHTIFCSRDASTANNTFTAFVIGNGFRYDRKTSGEAAGTVAAEKDYVITVSGDKLTATGNGGTITASNVNTPVSTPSSDLLLYGHNDSGAGGSTPLGKSNATASLARMKMYYFKVYDSGGNIRLDLVPVKNGSGDVGMYDRVSGNFYKSATGDEFTAGSELSSFLGQLVLDPRNVAAGADERATGGDIILQEGDDYIHVFYDTTAEQTFTVNQNSTVRILAVGGGGAGGAQGGPNGRSGGGGAGGYVEQSNVALQTGDYTLQVGAGGSAVTYKYGEDRQGVSGQSSWLKRGDAFVVPEALGGGGGGAGSLPGLPGGSGGGGAYSAGGGSGTTGQGYAGGGSTSPNNQGSGGGGAAGAGVRVGGAAKASDILGTEYAFAGGGGGANLYTGTEYKGGGATISGETVYVGGSGGTSSNGENGKAGVAGTGSGGGGSARNAGGDSIHSGAGGSGIVIIRVTSGSPVGPTPVSDLTVEFSAASYTGSTIDPTITIKNGSTTVASGTASAINSGSYDLTVAWPSGVTIKNAGDYTLTVTGGGTTYTGSKTATFTVAKFLLTPSATATSTYTGTTQDCPNQTVSGKSLKGLSTMGHGQRTPCGTQTVKFTLNDTANYTFPNNATVFNVSWTINKGNNSWTQVPAISTPTWSIYGGQGTLTPGKVKWGTLNSQGYATAAVAPATWTKDGISQGTFNGTLPTEKGVYTITYTCPTSKSLQSGLAECWNLPSPSSYTISFEIVDRLNDITPPHFSSARTFKYDGIEQSVTLAGFDSNTMTEEASSVKSATAAGIYKVYVTPKSGNCWSDTKSTATRALEWGIVPSGYTEPFGADRSFLKTLENSPYRVAASALPPGISGGDIFLRFPNPDGQSYDFVHVYTNTAASGFVFENDSGIPRQGRVLLVGGGGGSGSYAKGAGELCKYCNAPGGGGGGGVKSIRDLNFLGAYSIVVGAGGAGGSNKHGENGMPSSIASAGWGASVGGGGGGARSGSNSHEWIDGYSGATGGGGSGYKSASADEKGKAGTAIGYDGYDGGLATYQSTWLYYRGGAGGGAGATGPDGGASGGLGFLSDILWDDICFGGGGSGGVGSVAGGTTCSGGLGGGGGNYNYGKGNWYKAGYPGVCGMGGGGGAPGYSTSAYTSEVGVRGGDGIVIIRYTDTVQAPEIKVVEVPEVPSFVYNHELQDTGIRDTEDYTVSDDVTGMYIQEYTITLTLRDPDNMQWSDGTTQPQHIKWYIRTDYNVKLDSFYYGLSTNHTRVASDPAGLNADFIFRQRVGEDYRYVNIFTNNHASVTIPSMTADVLLIGGGGGGGAGLTYVGGGGGGAGGVVLKESQTLSGTYSITIGAGGSRGSRGSAGGNGGDTYLSLGGSQVAGLIAHGGGGGAGGNESARNGKDGASGGGSAGVQNVTTMTAGQCIWPGEGHEGGIYAEKYQNYAFGGGGGGAGSSGERGNGAAGARTGGNGRSLSILGYDEYFGGGGASQGNVEQHNQNKGGLGGGGNGVWRGANPVVGDGMDGQGGGGGSSGYNSQVPQSVDGGRGGCGLVVIVYSRVAGQEIDKPVLTKGAHTFTGSAIDVTDSLTAKDHLVFNGTWSATNVGTYTFTAQPEPGYCWTGTEIGDPDSQTPIAFEWSIVAKPIQGNITIDSIPNQLYTGSAITPSFTVRDTARNVVLTLGTDYTAEYIGNVNIGTATIKITGIGNYTATENTTFQIVANENEQGYYVTPDADGSGGGTGWEDPTTLAGALTKAQSATKPVAIYMKEGTYAISSACSLSNPGQDVKIMGGYTGVGLARSLNFSVLNGGGTSGFLLLNTSHKITLQQLRFTNGNASNLVLKDGTGAMTVEHCLFDNTKIAPAISVSGGQTTVENCTFYNNEQGSITATGGGSATVKNSIMWRTSTTAEARGGVTLMYTIVPNATPTYPVVVDGTGVKHDNPEFVDAANGDFHLKSTAGHYTSSGWVTDAVSSPAIDAGDPAADCSAEPKNDAGQNFGLNLGVYGDTAQASKSPVRATVTVTLDKGEGSGGTPSVTGLEGTAMPAVSVPMRENYNFMGYFTATAGGGTKYYDENGQPVGSPSPVFSTSVTTLYANWEENIHYIERPTQGTASWTYDGQDHRPSFAETDGYTVAYSAAAPWKNAGTYTVTFTLKPNCEWADGADVTSPIVFTYTIKKLQLYVVPEDKTIAYGDVTPTLTYHLEGFVDGEDASSAGVTGAPLLGVAYSPGNACGRYQMSVTINGWIVPNPLSAPNYSFGWNEERTGYLTVTQRVATLSWANLSFVYDGTAKVPTCTISNLYGSDAVSATVAVDDGPAIQPGTYTARVTGLTGDKAANYSLPATVTKSFTIVSESVILDDNGGDEGEGSVRLIDGAPEKATVTRPFYNGYSFRGYWTAQDGGSQVYDQTGTRVANPPTLASGDTIYAHWEFIKTYYLAGKDSASGSLPSFDGTPSGKECTANGWAETSVGNSVRHTVESGHDYVAESLLATRSINEKQVFKGDKLTSSSWIFINSDVEIDNLVSKGCNLCQNISTTGSRATLSGNIQIDNSGSAKSLYVVLAGRDRHLDIAAKITGESTTFIKLKPQSNLATRAEVKFSGDASEFKGKLQESTVGETYNAPFDLYFTGSFGGSVDSLPAKAENIRFNYAGLTGAGTKGLPISSTTIPARVKDSVTFFGSSDFTAANFPLMTFPAGTTVNLSDFTVYHAATVDDAKTAFANLGKIVNGDGSVTLVANFAIAVTLDPNGGTGGTTQVSAPVGAAMPAITVPTYAGHTFLGYYTAATGGTQYYTATGASARNCDFTTATVTLYAQWLTQVAKPNGAKLTYNGSTQTGVAANAGYDRSGDYEARNAGTYTVTATLKPGYIWSDGSSDPYDIVWTNGPKSVSIVKANVTAVPREYNGTPIIECDYDPQSVVSGFINGDDVRVASVVGCAQIQIPPQFVFSGMPVVYQYEEDPHGDAANPKSVRFEVTLAGNDADNYAPASSTSDNGRIDPREISLAWAGGPEFAYDGNPHKPTVTLGNFVDGEVSASTATVVCRDSHGTVVANPTEPGAYTATVTAWSVTAVPDSNYKDSNYTLPAEASYAFTIGAAPNAWATVPKLSATTFPANRPASITWGVAQYGGDATATLDGATFAKAGTLPANLSVGEHTLVFTVAATASYTGLSETLVFTVTEALYDLHAITKDGPTVKGVPSSWLSAAFPGAADYQDAFLSTNVNGVTGWAAYILGFEGGDVPTAAIIEQATESAMSDGKVMLTVALPDLPTAREVEGCEVKYSLLTSTDAETLRKGGGDIVAECEKCAESSFEVPAPTGNHAYYRIRIHFIFTGGDDPLDRTGYVRVIFNSTASNNLNYLQLNFKDEEGNYVSHPDVVSSGKDVIAYYCAFDGFNAGNNIPYETVYVAPPGAVLGDTEVKYYPSSATKNVVPGATATYANMSLTAVNAETAMVECDKIWNEITGGDLTLWNGLVETFISDRKTATEWTRGLTKLQAALQPNSTTQCRILVLGDSLSADFYYGCINAMIEAAYNTTNVSITCQQNNNHGCYEYQHSGDYIDGQTQKDCFYRLQHIDFNDFDLVMFAGTTQLRGHIIGTTGEDAVEAVKKYITGTAADGGAGARANASCEFIMVSPLISVDSRLDYGKKYGDDGTCYWGTPQEGDFVYWNSVATFNHCGQEIASRNDWDYTQDPWMNQDYNQLKTGLSRMRNKCSNIGIAYWDLTQLCYQYLYQSGKPFAYFNRDAQHSNRYGKQFAARVVFEVIKMICPRPQP